MRKHIERLINRIAAAAAVGALAVVLLVDSASWLVVLASWLAGWVILQLVFQSVATTWEQRLPSPPYHLLVKPVETMVSSNSLDILDVGCACCGARALSVGLNGEVIR